MWKLAMAIKVVYKPTHKNRNGLENLGHRLCSCKDVMLLPEDLFLYILSTQFYFILFITVIVTTI